MDGQHGRYVRSHVIEHHQLRRYTIWYRHELLLGGIQEAKILQLL